MSKLFPEIEPYKTHRLAAAPHHQIYVEEVGNPKGEPILFLHGGPGSGITTRHRRLFDPQFYRIILFDQRGAGKSTPHASLEDNTTWHLVSDIEMIRKTLGIDKWVVFGGSWGSTLALAYSQTHPEAVTGLILRGIFLCRPDEIKWFYQEGCDQLFPDLWKDFVKPIPENERHNMVAAYYKRLTSGDPEVMKVAARAWATWEGSTLKLLPDQKSIDYFGSDHTSLSLARIECHYFFHNSFFNEKNNLLNNVDRIRKIPTIIVHGRYDVVCPIKSAFDLKAVWPEAEFRVIPDAGHAFDEPGILATLMGAAESFKSQRTFLATPVYQP